MPTYTIPAPDGKEYSIDGPEGASDEEVKAEVIRQFPHLASGPKAPKMPWAGKTNDEYAKKIGATDTPVPEDMGYFERLGKNFQGSVDAMSNLPENVKNLFTGGGEGRGMAALGVVGGALAPLSLATAPVGAAVGQAVKGVTGNENAAEVAGTTAEMALPLGFAHLAQAGKLPTALQALAASMGIAPINKPIGNAKDFIKEASSAVKVDAKTAAEDAARIAQQAAEQARLDAIWTVQRGVVMDPQGMKRTGSLLEQAQQSQIPDVGNITAGAGKETNLGQVARTVPSETDVFRTTQQSIEKVTGNQQDLLRERGAMAEQILEEAKARQTAREMAGVETQLDSVSPKIDSGIAGPVSRETALARAKGKREVGTNAKDVEQYLLTDNETYLKRAAKSDEPTVEELGAALLKSEMSSLAREGGGKRVGNFRAVLKSLFQESTRELSEIGGAPGKVLAKEMIDALWKGEREAGRATTLVGEWLKGFTGYQKNGVVEFLDAGIASSDPAVMEVGKKLKGLLEEVSTRAQNANMTIKLGSGEKLPWRPLQDHYFPHYTTLDLDNIRDGGKYLTDAIKQISREEEIPMDAARQMLENMMANSERRFGNLEFSRAHSWRHWDQDPERVLKKYFDGSYKRLNLAEQFGSDYKRADELATAIGQAGGGDRGMNFAREYIDRITGREIQGVFNQSLRPVRSAAMNFMVASKLGQAVIANASQPILSFISSDAKSFVRGVREAFTTNGKEFAGMTGSALDSTMAQIVHDLGGTRLGQTVLQGTGFNKVEKFNRVLAANIGKNYAENTWQKLQYALNTDGVRVDFYKRELTRLNIDPIEALSRGRLTDDDLYKAGQKFTKRTQFSTGPQDLPMEATSELGKFAFQFKTFSFKAGQYMKDEILTEAKRGNYKPLMKAAMVMPLSGEIVNDVQALINGRTRSDNIVERIADDVASVGGLSLAYSMAKALEFGPSAITGMLLGPAFSEALRATYNTYSLLMKQNPQPIMKQGIGAIPVVGPMVANRLFPSKEEERRRKAQE